jgi:hypothetical protein
MSLTLVVFLGMNSNMLFAGNSLPSNDEIINLMLCYGTGTDAIGDSTRADPLGDGVAIYADCFTDDAVFRAWFPGTDFNDPGQAVTIGPGDGMTGPENWAGFVFGVFDGTYTFTQHSLSNFIVNVNGSTGTLTAYLNAAHVTQEAGAVTAVAVAHGTYTLQVEKIDGAWRVNQLDLKLINFTPFF